MTPLEERYALHRARLEAAGQEHVLRFWPELDDEERRQLLDDLDQVDLGRCTALIESHVRRVPEVELPLRIEPPKSFPAEPGPDQKEQYTRAVRLGEKAIGSGKVAAFTVAGGQGTRLGYDGPKGGFRISPVRNACLFELFAESLLGVERRYGRRPRWYIMTSPGNHAATLEIFDSNRWFGLRATDIRFFPQGQMPAFTPDGLIALSERQRVALGPDGHGGSLRALAESGALEQMREDEVEYVSYFQVDNPLARSIDPLFIGLHIANDSEMSSKAVAKASDSERVGVFCVCDGRLTVIEYSDLPPNLATARNADGSRTFDAGSIAVHVLNRAFVERLTAEGTATRLPWHRAEKAVTVVDAEGNPQRPAKPNVVKLELFVFDAIPLARNPLVLFTPREEEFSPVKNAAGVDSAVTARRDMVRRAARWLESSGVRVPRTPEGEPAMPIEISPAFALDAEDLKRTLAAEPELVPGKPCLLA